MKSFNKESSLWNTNQKTAVEQKNVIVKLDVPTCCWYFGCCWFYGDVTEHCLPAS